MSETTAKQAPGSEGHNSGDEPKTVFLISPIGKPGTPEHHSARQVLDYLVKKVFHSPEWAVVRADDESSPDSITTQVIDRIVTADLIIADLTDHNPNVFYELAVAHGYERPIIQIMKEGQSIPFDVVDQRVIFYDLSDPASVDAAKESLQQSATWLESHAEQPRSPLTAHGKFTAISSAAPAGGPNEAIADALNEIVSRLSRLERSQRDFQREIGRSSSVKYGRQVTVRADGSHVVRETELRALTSELEAVESRLAASMTLLDSLQNLGLGETKDHRRDEILHEFRALTEHRDSLKSQINRLS